MSEQEPTTTITATSITSEEMGVGVGGTFVPMGDSGDGGEVTMEPSDNNVVVGGGSFVPMGDNGDGNATTMATTTEPNGNDKPNSDEAGDALEAGGVDGLYRPMEDDADKGKDKNILIDRVVVASTAYGSCCCCRLLP